MKESKSKSEKPLKTNLKKMPKWGKKDDKIFEEYYESLKKK